MATYYVRPDGNNINAGTGYLASQAWATLTKAAQTMVAGDICYVAPGVYKETVTPTNSGSSGAVRITFEGDPWCNQFLDMTKGDVVVTGLNNDADTTIARSYGFDCSTKTYITIKNIIVKNVSSTAFYIHNTGNVIENCKALDVFSNFAVNLNNNCKINNCTLEGGVSVVSGASGVIIENSIIIALNGASLSVNGSSLTYATAYNSYFNGHIYGNMGAITLYGCTVEGNGYYDSNLSQTTLVRVSGSSNGYINAYGCTFNGGGCGAIVWIYSSSACSFTSCKFKNASVGVRFQSGSAPTFNDCEFDSLAEAIYNAPIAAVSVNNSYFSNCQYAFDVANASGSITSTSCRFYSVYGIKTGTGPHTNTTPIYGPPTENYAGNFVTDQTPLVGSKSLRFKGKTYAPTYIIWVPCEAGVAKTVKLKAKKDFTNASNIPFFILGTTTVNMADNTTTQDISITYTHHKTELVPMFICAKFDGSLRTLTVDEIAA